MIAICPARPWRSSRRPTAGPRCSPRSRPATASTTPTRSQQLDGVDCLWVGHFDLSCSLGVPGEFGHKKFTDAIATVAKACRKHKKSLGRLVPTVDEAVDRYGEGFDFICYSGDVWALQGAVQAGLTEIRARTGKAAVEEPGEGRPQSQEEMIAGRLR